MIPVFLTRVKTHDSIVLDGIVVEPRKKSDAALIWIHGLASRFSSGQDLIKELSSACRTRGIAYFKFNTRGHDVVNRDLPKKKALQGAAFEKFEECVPDIRAMISFARKRGYKKIVLAGHSTGANKVAYYLHKTKDPAVKALMLLGPVNDISAGRKKFGAAGLRAGVALAKKLGRKNPNALMPEKYGIISARRFVSMYESGHAEDTFPYLDPRAQWKGLKGIRVPIAVIFGERDEYLDRPAHKLIDTLRIHAPLAKSFSGVIIRNADHGFKSKEKELTDAIIRFIKRGVV